MQDKGDEFDGGTIQRECPDCGAYCKIPETYHVRFNGVITEFYALSWCKRCGREVELSVEFI